MMTEGDNLGKHRFHTGFGTALFPLPDVPYALLRDLIVERTGVLFDAPKRALLADKLSELVAVNGLTSFLDYYYLLRYEATESHWNALMDRLAVPETFFWRQAEQIDVLARVVAPAHFAGNSGRPLRIWSAGCCTGEEPVSIAMALAEVGLLNGKNVEITGTDGSGAMVERAKCGVYGERSFRQLPAALKTKYFEAVGDRWRPVEQLSRQIRWGVVNLARPAEIEPYAGADVIFCRNVFIYFSDDAIRSVIRVFSKNMPRNGYLFVGASESLTRLGVDLELAEVGNAFAYVKEGRRQTLEREGLSAIGNSAARSAAP
jgi:chemotaxis protein methyltransferase CheR